MALAYVPHPEARHGGRVTAALASRLAGRVELGIVCLRGPGEDAVDDELRSRCALVEEVPLRPLSRRRARLLASLLRGTPAWVAETRSEPFARRLSELAGGWTPDVVHLEPSVTAQYLSSLDRSPARRLLVEHDPGAGSADLAGIGPWRDRLVHRLDARAWRRFGRATLPGLDAVVAFTERDAAAVRTAAPGLRVERIPFGTDPPAAALDARGADPPRVLFVGGYRHLPNVDAAVRLATAIFPRVAAAVPGATLELVGAEPPAAVRRLAGPGVVVPGRVDDVVPHLDRAAVVAVPLRLGGGMRVKVVEALAAGKAVVATPRALEGLDAAQAGAAVVAESDEELAAAIVALLRDPDRREEVARRARSWALEHAGWDASVAAFARLYESLAASPPRSA
jgi:glycosyltransferase involved in cell wall biosynthesis